MCQYDPYIPWAGMSPSSFQLSLVGGEIRDVLGEESGQYQKEDFMLA